MDTNVIIIIYILCIFIYTNYCSTIDQNNRLCNCDKVDCHLSSVKVNRVCRAFKGSFAEKSSPNSRDCKCCAKCVIKKSFGQSCLPSGVDEIVVKCEKHLYCDSRNGFICLKKNMQKYFNEQNVRDERNTTAFMPHRRTSNHWIPKAVLQSINISAYNHMMDKTRLKRSPIKIGFGSSPEGKKKKNVKTKVPSDEASEDNTNLRMEAPDETETEGQQQQQQQQQPQQEQQQQQQQQSGKSQFTDEESKKCANCETEECRRECRMIISKQVKMIKGGHSNSINQNSGPTFIVNNNYYGFRGGKLTKLKALPKGSHTIDVKMDKDPTAKENSGADSTNEQNNAADAEKGDDYPTEKPRIRKPKPKKKPKIDDDSESQITESPEVTTTTAENVTKKKKLRKPVEPETDDLVGQPLNDDSESVTVTIANKPTKPNKRIFYRRMEKTIQEDEGFEGENSERSAAKNDGSPRTKTKKTKPVVSDISNIGSNSDANSDLSEGIVKTPQKPAKPASPSSGKSKPKHKVTVITEQRFGQEGQRTRTTYIFDGDEWVIVDINGEISDGYPSKEDLKLLNEKVVNPQKNDKAVVNIEEVSLNK